MYKYNLYVYKKVFKNMYPLISEFHNTMLFKLSNVLLLNCFIDENKHCFPPDTISISSSSPKEIITGVVDSVG